MLLLSRPLLRFTLALAPACCLTPAFGHDGDTVHEHEYHQPAADREWILKDSPQPLHGSFVALQGSRVIIRQSDGYSRPIAVSRLSDRDQAWLNQRQQQIQALNTWVPAILPAVAAMPLAAAATADNLKLLQSSFAPFAPAVKTRSDDNFFYIESAGMPDHQMMVGITAWQQQVPIPQAYTGSNAWRIPLNPVPAKQPMSAKTGFFRGAIAMAVNGVPIFNPIKNDGRTDTLVAGELDEFGGHCGRADDYHYHIAPVHLQKQAGQGQPIAWALDGYPIFGYQDPSAPDFAPLDQWNGHRGPDGSYHYHATKTYPYLNGGFFGEVVERDGQVDPQPRAESPRPALPPLRGAKIVAFREANPKSYVLTYEINGRPGTVSYTLGENGSVNFTFRSPDGQTETQTYTGRGRGGPGGGPGGPSARGGQGRGNPEPPPGDEPPPKKGPGPGKGGGKGGAKKGGKNGPPKSDAPPENQPERRKSSPQSTAAIQLKSSSVDANGRLSIDCTCDGKSQSPAIAWNNPPAGTKFLAVSLWHEAPDQEKSYWLLYNIPASVSSIPQNAAATSSAAKGVTGINDRKQRSYDPMCSRGPGLKTYHITVYALSSELQLDPSQASRAELLKAIQKSLLAESTLDFEYERQ